MPNNDNYYFDFFLCRWFLFDLSKLMNAERHDCPFCVNANHLMVRPTDFAYECNFCHARQWLDTSAKDEYILLHGLSEDEAEKELEDGIPDFAMGDIGL